MNSSVDEEGGWRRGREMRERERDRWKTKNMVSRMGGNRGLVWVSRTRVRREKMRVKGG